ncbi:MAG: radical SAM protein, partial [Nitrososphaerota archaeon]
MNRIVDMTITAELVEKKTAKKLITKTRSICPECNAILPAEIFEDNNKIYIRKNCPKHGEFEELYFGDASIYHKFAKWLRDGKGTGNPNVEVPRVACP